MKFTVIPGTDTVEASLTPGDIVTAVDAYTGEIIGDCIFEFPEGKELTVLWTEDEADIYFWAYDLYSEIVLRIPGYILHLLTGDTVRLTESV